MPHRFARGFLPALLLAALPALSSAAVFIGVSVNIAPPPLPVYVQPDCPQPGYIWVPGYWAWNDGAYYWVPGTWVLPPEVGLLWTPGYWGWDDGVYIWHAGYWGPQVGFYGGVDYGYGYDGNGFDGGYWRGGEFFYNRAVVHVGPTFVTNVYYHPVVYRTTYEHVSFNGGPGGVMARPSREQLRAEREHHVAFTPAQQRQQRLAFADRSLRADYNHGRPPIAATARPAVFHGSGVFAARAAGGPVHSAPSSHAATPRRGGAAPMRSDRPAWATGQTRAGRPMERGAMSRNAANARPHEQQFARSPAQQPRFESRPQPNFPAPRVHPQQTFRPPERAPAARPPETFRPPERPAARPQETFRPPERPAARPQQSFRPPERGPAARPPPPREQRGGGERHPPPPDDHGRHGR